MEGSESVKEEDSDLGSWVDEDDNGSGIRYEEGSGHASVWTPHERLRRNSRLRRWVFSGEPSPGPSSSVSALT